jgi:hypothetical protein
MSYIHNVPIFLSPHITFFISVHILLVALFFVSLFIYLDETDSKQIKNPKENPNQPMDFKNLKKKNP